MIRVRTATATPTVRELKLRGDSDPARRAGRTVIARSDVELALHTDADVTKCLRALEASDARLAADPTSKYEWNATWLEHTPGQPGGKVVFGVSWYDQDFFKENKDVYLGRQHVAMFTGFGADEADVTVQHWSTVN